MKTAKSVLLSIDVVVQLISLVLLGGSVLLALLSKGETTIFVGLVLFFLGIWQVGSGVIFGIVRNDGKRGEYVIGSLVYVSLLFFGSYVLNGSSINGFVTWILITLFFLIIPSGIAIWYFKYSRADLTKLELENKNRVVINFDMDDVLDCEEILKHERS